MLPTNFEDKTAFFKAYSKTLNRIIPSTGQSDVVAGGVTIFQLPQASVVSLKSFRLNFHAKCNGDATHIVNFPRFMASMIERLEIFCNGQSIQNITNYGTIYNLMRDYSKDYPKYAAKPCNNADPSNDFLMTAAGAVTAYDTRTCTSTNLTINSSEKDYCIDDWVGFLDSAPEFFNTNLVGNMEIHITWAPNSVLAGTAGITPTYTISKLIGWVDVIHFKDDAYINELDRKLSTNGEIAIPYKNYRSYLGATTVENKTSTTRITESTQSLDKIMLTYLPSTRTTYAPLNTDLNSTNYYRRSGLGLGYNATRTGTGTIAYEINSQLVGNPMGFNEVWEETMKAFELDRDNVKHMNPLIKNLGSYEKEFFVSALSTSHLNGANEDKTIISGLDTQATSLNISVITDSTNGKASDAAQSAQPLIITDMTAILRIGAGRQVSVLF
jgi:hypothetical protein